MGWPRSHFEAIIVLMVALILAGGPLFGYFQNSEPDTFSGSGSEETHGILVAAHDSPDNSGAQYLCDGIDDQLEIQLAYDEAQGEKVILLPGHYYLSAPVTPISGVTLEGQGEAIITQHNSTNLTPIIGASWVSDVCIENLTIDGNQDGQNVDVWPIDIS